MDSRKVGIVGGGQLGRMMAEAGHRLGIKTVILDRQGKDSPAGQVATSAIQGSCMLADADEAKARELAAVCDVITIEVEHVDVKVLAAVEASSGTPVHPSPACIAVVQDKLRQKQHLATAGIAVPDFMEVGPSVESLGEVGARFGYPYMLKSRTGAYDGNGNFIVQSAEHAAEGFTKLVETSLGLYAERWVPFVKELAVMVVASPTELKCYPVVETTQKESICHTVTAPATIPASLASAARVIATNAVRALNGVGIFGVELFLLKDGRVLLNEVAPRPHNSGHYTMESCCVDQFENHLRAVLGLPLGSGDMVVNAAIMVNVLGEGTMAGTMEPLVKAMADGTGGIHWYGKAGARVGRKMAHITFVGPSLSSVQLRAEALGVLKLGTIAPSVGIIMGSDSDLPTMRAAADICVEFGVSYEMTIVSAHRTPDRMFAYGKEAAGRGLKVIIAGAGGAAHLPGMVAALTTLPVIGVPVKSSALSGVDSLYSMVQMPRGVPVATVAIDNSTNAGLLAVRILSVAEPALLIKMEQWNRKQADEVLEKADHISAEGVAEES